MADLVFVGGVSGQRVVGGFEVCSKSRATMSSVAKIFLKEEDYGKVIVFSRSFNARTPATVEGEAVAWPYADGHGQLLVAVLRRGKSFEFWSPGHHGHGPGEKKRGFVSETGVIRWEDLPSAKTLQI